jgi:hypothetical protein
MLYGTCEKCGLPVEDPETPAFPITGWEVLRSQGGANAIRLRERVPDRVRHVSCLPGALTGQPSLFESTAA